MTVIGTSSQVEWKGRKLREAFENDEELDEKYSIDRLELIDCDMVQDEECYYKAIKEHRPDYVIHTACPFMQDVAAADESAQKIVEDRQIKYRNATKLLAKGACRENVRKIVMTGAATSIIGNKPTKEGTYFDSNAWADVKEVTRPNEKAKFLAEKACWDEVLLNLSQNGDSGTRLTTILPYFISGPPIYREAYNSSCQAIQEIINNTQYGFPEVMLPITDVRDVSQAHILSITDPLVTGFNGRYMMSTQSLWFSEIIQTLRARRHELGLGRIKTRKIGQFGIWFAAMVINP